MRCELKKLPIGIKNFEEIRRDNFYYVDKTQFIEKLLYDWGKANLFTRPRRFGKSLSMSMLKSFFEIGCDKTLFEGLYILKNKTLCEKYMGQFPVISISLKGVYANHFEKAKVMLAKVINEEARRLQYLLDSNKLTEVDKDLFRQFLQKNMEEDTLIYSLREITELLNKHYEKKVILLIDEYDVPLAKASKQGYYEEMILLIRNLFENVLKTNDHLYFAVLTGCLRVAKESIFTGLNHFKVYPITNVVFDEYFGFTDHEVRELLEYYKLEEHYTIVKEWYDGYRFGKVDVYCPWDMICYCEDSRNHHKMSPQNYWSNTSENDIIFHFIENMEKGKYRMRIELEKLIHGESIQKDISQELTYKDLYSSSENIWSALFMTGYLTQRGEPNGNRYHLVIPNREIRNIMTEHILKCFKEEIKKDGVMLDTFCNALIEGKTKIVENLFTEYMQKTISIRDTFVRKPIKENFYHGILLGILSYKSDWIVESNKESGNGFSDIMIQIEDLDMGIIIEVKYAEDGEMERECKKAIEQINRNEYCKILRQNGMYTILKYAIACNRKKCYILLESHTPLAH